MRNGVYAHPWDLRALRARGGLARLAGLGRADGALASAYHAGRWLTPPGEPGLVRFLEDGVVHFRAAGEYGALRPLASSEVPASGPSPMEELCGEAPAAGIRPVAWTVLFHNSRLGRAHPGSCVKNAWGDVYDYALCPARPEVQEYGLALVRDLARHDGLAIELEAAGFMGHGHGSHHDKGSFAKTRYLDFLLSYCFCDRCVEGLGEHGVDGEGLRAATERLLRARLTEGDSMDPPADHEGAGAEARLGEDLGGENLAAMFAHRRAVNVSVLRQMRAAVGPGTQLGLHLQPDPMFTGSQMGQALDVVAEFVDEVVFTHYGETPAQILRALGEQEHRAPGVRTLVAFWPKAPQIQTDDDVRAVAAAAAEGGCDGLRIYHIGLLPARTLERVAGVLA